MGPDKPNKSPLPIIIKPGLCNRIRNENANYNKSGVYNRKA